jgi:hypothetical protein
MPSLITIPILGNVLFLAKGFKLPVGHSKPGGGDEGKQYDKAFKAADKIAIPKTIPPWFMPAEIPNKYYQDACDETGKAFKEMHDGMINAVKFAHDLWKLLAKFKDLQIMSLSAIGSPGCLDGPELESFIKIAPDCAAWSGNKGKFRDAVAKGVSKCFKDWMGQVSVPGLPWYPAFVAYPLAMAPPMPNIPMPLITCISGKMTSIIMSNDMKSAMIDAFDGGLKDKDKDKHHEAAFESIATVLSLAFLMWLPMQMVMLVLGKGPVPTYAPPFVPVGPVVGGDNIAIPGHLMA